MQVLGHEPTSTHQLQSRYPHAQSSRLQSRAKHPLHVPLPVGASCPGELTLEEHAPAVQHADGPGGTESCGDGDQGRFCVYLPRQPGLSSSVFHKAISMSGAEVQDGSMKCIPKDLRNPTWTSKAEFIAERIVCAEFL